MRDDYEFIYWRPCSDVPDIPLHPDISEAKTSDDEAIMYMMMTDVLDADGTIDVHELLTAITELSDSIPPPEAVDTYDPLDHMVLTADGSIEITLKRGDPAYSLHQIMICMQFYVLSLTLELASVSSTNAIGSRTLKR